MMKEKSDKEMLKQLCDLTRLAKQSTMAFKYLLHEVEVVPLANCNEEPDFNQEDLSFHPNGKCGCITLGDDYIFGIRCDHLVWFEGNCEGLESFWTPDDECEAYRKSHELTKTYNSIMVCGNHKGIYMQKLIVFHEKEQN